MADGRHIGKYIFATPPQQFVWFVRRCKIRPERWL